MIAFDRFAIAIVVFFLITSTGQADHLVLRSAEVIQDIHVTAVDSNGVQTAEGKSFGWSQIETGTISDALQSEFDRHRDELALPLFRIESRLLRGDLEGARSIAESLPASLREREGKTALLINIAIARGALSQGDRVSALPAILKITKFLAGEGWPEESKALLGSLQIDQKTLLCDQCLPIWTAEDAKRVLPAAIETMKGFERDAPLPFYGQMALIASAAGDEELAKKTIAVIGNNPSLADFSDLYKLQQTSRLSKGQVTAALREKLLASESLPIRALAIYWIGRGLSLGDLRSRQQAALEWLRVHANWGDQLPELGADSLAQANLILAGDAPDEASVIRQELLSRYPKSIAALRIKESSRTRAESPQ